ncbi:hypothetical protein A1O7_04830 [Cladophialophora yegresii CBS 114405]|uniref:Uncharacterized protein n=1 Tax=Cladophialophora yegresii CBS 114405 TaxID=1182544 RepID=W9VXV9_9EURO|nr:uncharacterized protein A1O7_04830 [Cladophialophora yegresii CBS 114405]EXJ60677.1 hypothetical protein A1O7_04830 [Cladophialophora yegresii CBS 114405]
MSPNGISKVVEPKDGRLSLPHEYMPGLPAKHLNTPVEVTPSPKEKAAGRFNDANIKLFLSGVHRDGVVVLKNVIDPDHLDVINDFMVEDTKKELSKEKSLQELRSREHPARPSADSLEILL